MKARTKRTVLLLVIGALFSGVLPQAGAGSFPVRTDSGTYESPAPFYIEPEDCALAPGCVLFATGAKDRFVSIEIADLTGRAVYGYLVQDGRYAQPIDLEFCGRTQKPIRIRPRIPIQVLIYPEDPVIFELPCTDGPADTPTTGTVTATFSSRP